MIWSALFFIVGLFAFLLVVGTCLSICGAFDRDPMDTKE